MARPRKPIDADLVEKLAAIHCTLDEIALICGCSHDTIERRFASIIAKGKATGKTSLRKLQWESAQKGNVVMQIWLGKQILGQKDESAVVVEDVTLNLKIGHDDDGDSEPQPVVAAKDAAATPDPKIEG